MTGKLKLILQQVANRFGYQIRRLNSGVDLVDPYSEQLRIIGSNASTVFEVGAADGRDCLRYAELFPTAQVFAFEPVPESFTKVFEKSIRCPRIHAFNLALSDKPGDSKFYISNWIDSSSLLMPKQTGSTFDVYQAAKTSITVTVDTIDQVCIREKVGHIDLLKMDAQGAELKILSGASQMLARESIDLIFTEVHFLESYEGAARFDQIMALLAGYGFKFHNFYGLNHNQRGQATWGDALFVHKRIKF
jgi:FkbM family methyltransferase